MRKKSFLSLILVFATALMLAGCSGIGGSIPDEKEVKKAVSKVCPTEKLEWGDTESEQGPPEKVTYHIKSAERELSFDVVSTLDNITMFKPEDTPIYTAEIKIGYVDAVQEIYKKEYFEAEALITYGGNTVYYYDDSDFPAIAYQIVSLSDIYAPEREYNSDEWLKEHPIGEIALVWNSDMENPENGNKVRTVVIEIDGCLTYDEVLERIQKEYDKKVKAGEILG